MEIAVYLIKSTICTAVMYGYYLIFLKDKTFHDYNRFYLLFTVAISLILPFLKIEYFTINRSEKTYLIFEQIQFLEDFKNTNDEKSFLHYWILVIIVVAVFFVMKTLAGIFTIFHLKKSFHKKRLGKINFYETNIEDAPFSFFKNLFWKASIDIESDHGKQIFKHEMVHIEQKHSLDKLFLEIISSIFWFNLFFWLIKKEISLIHEYLADTKALKGTDSKAFAKMLLASKFSGVILPGTSPFINSNLKKRLKMIQKPKTKNAYARRFFALPFIFTIAFFYVVDAKNKEIAKTNDIIEKNTKIRVDTLSSQRQEAISKIRSLKEAVSKTEKIETDKIVDTLNRDYEKKPLTFSEIEELKDEAKAMKLKVEAENEKRKSNMIVFKFDEMVSYQKNRDESSGEDKTSKNPVKSTIMMLPLVDGKFYIDGQEYSKDELKAYMKTYEDEVFDKDVTSAKAPFKSVKMYRTPYGDKGFSKLDKVEFFTK